MLRLGPPACRGARREAQGRLAEATQPLPGEVLRPRKGRTHLLLTSHCTVPRTLLSTTGVCFWPGAAQQWPTETFCHSVGLEAALFQSRQTQATLQEEAAATVRPVRAPRGEVRGSCWGRAGHSPAEEGHGSLRSHRALQDVHQELQREARAPGATAGGRARAGGSRGGPCRPFRLLRALNSPPAARRRPPPLRPPPGAPPRPLLRSLHVGDDEQHVVVRLVQQELGGGPAGGLLRPPTPLPPGGAARGRRPLPASAVPRAGQGPLRRRPAAAAKTLGRPRLRLCHGRSQQQPAGRGAGRGELPSRFPRSTPRRRRRPVRLPEGHFRAVPATPLWGSWGRSDARAGHPGSGAPAPRRPALETQLRGHRAGSSAVPGLAAAQDHAHPLPVPSMPGGPGAGRPSVQPVSQSARRASRWVWRGRAAGSWAGRETRAAGP